MASAPQHKQQSQPQPLQYPLLHQYQQQQQQILLSTSPLKNEQVSPMVEMTSDAITHSHTNNQLFTKEQSAMLASLLAGFGSGTLSSIACAPLDLLRTRMQVIGDLNKKNKALDPNYSPKMQNTSLLRGLRDIVQSEGLTGCFRGLGPTLMTVPTFWSLYFPLYDVLKTDLHKRGIGQRSGNNSDNGIMNESSTARVPPLVHMTAAIMAGTFADFFCNPMFIVRTRMQTEALHYMEMPIEERKPHGIIQTVKSLHREGGISIFWRGFTASLLGLSHVAIQFPAYEYFKAEARERSANDQESAMDLLFASGISKMIATSLTYPHEVVRSRMMDNRGDASQQISLRKTFVNIVRNEGFGALYTGIHVSLVRVVPNCCITFMTYELILRWVKSKI